jgi:dihydrofolate reductase
MAKIIVDISISLDGFVAGPDISNTEPLGKGGEALHEWVVATQSWRKAHGKAGGETGVDDEISKEMSTDVGATIMGRKMYNGGEGPWESDSNADGWWGDEPPFKHPVFILTHHSRETVEKQNGTSFVFVTAGADDALLQAREAAGGKNVLVAGGAETTQQYLKAGVVDELRLHVAPVLLDGGVSLFGKGGLLSGFQRWTLIKAVESPSGVVHSKYAPRRSS